MQKETYVTNQSGMLYIVATPIGNLKDITLRALDTLKMVDIIVCEDTRVTRKLLSHYNIKSKPLISYGKHNLKSSTLKIISKLQGKNNIALVCDAGTPLISDPGIELILECKKNNIKYTSVPGASAVISAFSLSGVYTQEFYFGGFLENKPSNINKQLIKAKNIQTTALYFIAANKLLNIIHHIIEIFGKDQTIILIREITKIFEEVIVKKAEELLIQLNTTHILGEIVIIIPVSNSNVKVTTEELTSVLKQTLQKNNFKDTVNIVIKYYSRKGIKLNKKELYNLGLLVKKQKNLNTYDTT